MEKTLDFADLEMRTVVKKEHQGHVSGKESTQRRARNVVEGTKGTVMHEGS